MKKSNLLLFFILIVICLLLLDMTVLDRLLTGDLLSLFICEGMGADTVTALVGPPLRDVGSGLTVFEYALPSGQTILISYLDGKVLHINRYNSLNALCGMVLPTLLLVIALVETRVYSQMKNKRKEKSQ